MKEEKENLIEKIEKYCKKLKGWLYNIFPTRQHPPSYEGGSWIKGEKYEQKGSN
jgi:hypothetical protein